MITKDIPSLIKYLSNIKIEEQILNESNNFNKQILEAFMIRCVEQGFLDFFSKGFLNGTVHTCIGQELSAVAFAGQLSDKDFVTSNHRCHGHFISKTKKWRGLIDELLGKSDGICKGIGSSQHLYSKGFISNGPQGLLLPVGSGISENLKTNNGIVASFLGEGTLGEGVVYETFNIASLLNLPQIFVCENNFYSQSTPQTKNISGSIYDRFESFGIKTFFSNTWELSNLFDTCAKCINYTRNNKKPSAIIIQTYRLKAHSKGDDDRDKHEIEFFEKIDPINILLKSSNSFSKHYEKIESDVKSYFEISKNKTTLKLESYLIDEIYENNINTENEVIDSFEGKVIDRINYFLNNKASQGHTIIGEDIEDPYGGAFKATKGISINFPDQVITTPISEASIVGFAAGKSISGKYAIAEIMFGDFLTFCFDQIINGISKYYHMYGKQIKCPVIIRTPMGGKRGYGPTHSQCLEKFVCSIDNLVCVALNSLYDPFKLLVEAADIEAPKIVIENKLDYGKKFPKINSNLIIKKNKSLLGHLIIEPRYNDSHFAIITYGQISRLIIENYEKINEATDSIFQIICLQKINPINVEIFYNDILPHGKILVIEDGSIHAGISSEIVAQLVKYSKFDKILRLGAEPFPIPSPKTLEEKCLISVEKIINEIKNLLDG